MESKDIKYNSKKKWREENREQAREATVRWKKQNKEKYAKINRDYSKRHPERVKARNLANFKLKHLKKKGFIFHHKDYSKPLEVNVISIKQHKLIHGMVA